jgi:hypothetical protein
MPFNFARRPERKLQRLVGMLIEARIAYTKKVAIIRLPLNSIF